MTERDQVHDRRDLGAFIPALLDDYPLTPLEFRLYCRAVRRAGAGGAMHESLRKLARAWGVGDATLREARKLLVAANLLAEAGRTPSGQHKMVLTPESRWAPASTVEDLRLGVLRPETRPGRRQSPDDCGRSDRTPAEGAAVARDAPLSRGDRTPAVAATAQEGTPGKVLPKGPPPPTPSTTGTPPQEEVDDFVDACLARIRPRLAPTHARQLDTAGRTPRRRLHEALADRHGTGWTPAAIADAVLATSLDDPKPCQHAALLLRARVADLEDTPPATDTRRDLVAGTDEWQRRVDRQRDLTLQLAGLTDGAGR